MANTEKELKKKQRAIKAKVAAVKEQMTTLGVYRPEFDDCIRRYAELNFEYDFLYARYVAEEYPCAIDTDNKGAKKSPVTTTLEALRKDILAYAVQLGLTPAAVKKMKEGALAKRKQGSVLEKVLSDFGK